jgi:hypothetical protein
MREKYRLRTTRDASGRVVRVDLMKYRRVLVSWDF